MLRIKQVFMSFIYSMVFVSLQCTNFNHKKTVQLNGFLRLFTKNVIVDGVFREDFEDAFFKRFLGTPVEFEDHALTAT